MERIFLSQIVNTCQSEDSHTGFSDFGIYAILLLYHDNWKVSQYQMPVAEESSVI